MLNYRRKFDAINDNWDNTQSRLLCEDEDLLESLNPDEINRKMMFKNASLLDSIIVLILLGIIILAIL
ncbi:MAG: hypothetical protein K8Q99_00715 [Acholeplasmataceae bacterium]|nr:hypothetical protein [Acholeplasmataceae bacterium]